MAKKTIVEMTDVKIRYVNRTNNLPPNAILRGKIVRGNALTVRTWDTVYTVKNVRRGDSIYVSAQIVIPVGDGGNLESNQVEHIIPIPNEYRGEILEIKIDHYSGIIESFNSKRTTSKLFARGSTIIIGSGYPFIPPKKK
jgi:hypothetical protein